jgi:hypothetical protein
MLSIVSRNPFTWLIKNETETLLVNQLLLAGHFAMKPVLLGSHGMLPVDLLINGGPLRDHAIEEHLLSMMNELTSDQRVTRVRVSFSEGLQFTLGLSPG